MLRSERQLELSPEVILYGDADSRYEIRGEMAVCVHKAGSPDLPPKSGKL